MTKSLGGREVGREGGREAETDRSGDREIRGRGQMTRRMVFHSQQEATNFSCLKSVHTSSGTQPNLYPMGKEGALPQMVKQLERQSDPLPPIRR